jgi:hypothetical protein
MEREYPGQDTGKIELERILNCMKENKYDYTDSLDEGEFGGCYKLNFVKEIMYSDKKGNYINDRRIKVTIEFDTSYDYKNKYNKDKKGDFDYENDENKNKAKNFIKNLMNDTYGSNSSKKGGQKNRKTKKKTK